MTWPTFIRRLMAPVIYRRPVPGLAPARFYAYLHALNERAELDGDILEVGCHLGGTASFAYRFLQDIGNPKRYVCVDTFSGFVESQYRHDEAIGLSHRYRSYFAANSMSLTHRLMERYGSAGIELVQADIATVAEAKLPPKIAVCLLDVDLEVPVYEGLKRIYPRLVPGGVVLIDDCLEYTSWVGARIGYRRFVDENGLPEKYLYGFGIVEKPAT